MRCFQSRIQRTQAPSLAITSISTRASFGSPATATVDRAGATTPSGARYFCVDLVHRGEIAHALQKDGRLDDVHQIQPRLRQNSLDVFADTYCLLGDTARNKLAGSRIERHLSGGIEMSPTRTAWE